MVYLAVDQELQRKVALKFLHEHLLSNQERIERFKREARAASGLNHPNILTVHQIGEADGRQFIATEYVEGETLRQLINRKALNHALSLDIAVQTASALTAAHEANIIHRDIKPDNVVVRPDGYIKVLDFGIAKLVENGKPQSEAATMLNTEAGTILGTVGYMSPEQVRGFDLDPRTDIWSLGVVLFEMLTGHAPFAGPTNSDVVAAILHTDPFTKTCADGTIPQELQWILAKALAKDRDERYQTMKGLRTDLRNFGRDSSLVTGSNAMAVSTGLQSGAFSGVSATSRRRLSRAINSLAILPFVNESADANAEYLSDGITESIINNLSQLPKLKVLARSSVFRYKGQHIDTLEAGQRLNVRAVVTGRVRQAGESLMIAADLTDVGSETHLWGAHYTRKMTDIFGIQEEIAREICAKLRIKLSGKEKKRLARRSTEKSNAYDLYLKGRYFWNQRTSNTLEKALQYFNEAIEADAGYAMAYVGLADCYQLLNTYEVISPDDSVPKARAAAETALEIDPGLAEAHASLGHISMSYDWDWAAAELEFKQAIELKPNYVTAHLWYGTLFRTTGRFEDAIEEAQRALDLDPLSLLTQTSLAHHLYYARRYDEAIEAYRKIIEMDQNFCVAHMIGLPLEQKGMFEEAVAEFQLALKLSAGDPDVLGALGHTYAVSGRVAEARSVLSELNELSQRKHVGSYSIAMVHAGLREVDLAFENFEKAFAQRDFDLVLIKIDPRLDELRADPRYASLMERVGLQSFEKPRAAVADFNGRFAASA